LNTELIPRHYMTSEGIKTLLLNGCSFGECWTPTQEFVSALGCERTCNISKRATSFQRTCRSTIEWITQNGRPEFVIIPMTFSHRWELAISEKEDFIDGAWFPMQRKDFIDNFEQLILKTIDKEKIRQLIDLYYGTIPDVRTYWDKMFTEIIMLSAFLDLHQIPYVMFDMCNEFNRKHIKGHKGFEKIQLIEDNKNIIDIFNFCGNRHMWNSMPEKETHDFNIHHAPTQYKTLEKVIIEHVNKQ